jgi:hypothetical protein
MKMEENEQLQHNMQHILMQVLSLIMSSPMIGPSQIFPVWDKQIQDVVVNSHDTGHDEVPARWRPVPGIQQPEEKAYHMPWVPTNLYKEIIHKQPERHHNKCDYNGEQRNEPSSYIVTQAHSDYWKWHKTIKYTYHEAPSLYFQVIEMSAVYHLLI